MTRRFSLGDRFVDLDRATVTFGDQVLALTANEVGLLGVLVENAGRTVARDRLLVDGLGYRRALQTRAIDQAIWRLRRKLEEEGRPPRFLHSDPHEGYRLDLDRSTPSPDTLVGRKDELARLLAWVDAGTPEVWLVGVPGAGRSSLARVVDAARPGHTTRWRIADRAPDPSACLLRIGPLAPTDARAVLCRAAAATQGLPDAPLADVPTLDALADAVGGHPASLVALGRRTLLEPVASLRPENVLGAWVAGRTPELVAAASAWAVYPDGFDAADVEALGFTRATLARAWEECLVEGRAGTFRIAPVVARALPEPPADRSAFVRRVRAQVEPWLARAIERGEDEARGALSALRPRIWTAVALSPDDEALLWAWSFTGPSREAALAVAPRAPTARVLAACVRVLAGVGGTEDLEAVRDVPVDPALGLFRLRAALRLAVALGQDRGAVERLLPRFEAEIARSPTPMAVAAGHQARGLWLTRSGQPDRAADAYLAAVAVARAAGAGWLASQLLQNLAALAFWNGRAREGIAWCEEALRVESAVEASRADDGAGARIERDLRSTLASLALAVGDLDEFGRQLPLLEMLGVDPVDLVFHRASQALLEGQPERAAVQLAQCPADTARERRERGFLVAWTCLARGFPERAVSALDALEPPLAGRDEAMAALLRGLCAAIDGEAERARGLVAAVPPPRHAGAVGWIEAALAAGTSGFAAAVADAEGASIDDLGFRFARKVVERLRPG